MRTALSVVLTLCPPGPPERKTSMRRSLSSILTSTSSAAGKTGPVPAEVWIPPCSRQRGHGRRGGVDPAVLLGDGDALDPVHAGLVAQRSVCFGAACREHRF